MSIEFHLYVEMKKWKLLFLLFFLSFLVVKAQKIIYVSDPGKDKDIQPYIQEAVNLAVDGDIIMLPHGQFCIDRNVYVDKYVSILGAGYNSSKGTKLYRRETVSDDVLEGVDWRYVFDFNLTNSRNSDPLRRVVISDIYFKSKDPSCRIGDRMSSAEDYAIRLKRCENFVITNCKFQYFGSAAIIIVHKDTLASGVIYNNDFIRNYKVDTRQTRGSTLGYGVVIHGEDQMWVDNAEFGSSNFIFIEDNYFFEHRHAIAAGGTAKYVFRYNTVIDNLFGQAIDAHGGGRYGNTFSSRAYEVYGNHIENYRTITGYDPYKEANQIKDFDGNVCAGPSDLVEKLSYQAMLFRGGEGLVYNNTIKGYKYGMGITIEVPEAFKYPFEYQIGYKSALEKGAFHNGINMPFSDGDFFEWNNNYIPVDIESSCLKKINNSRENLLKSGRDYHVNTIKPFYKNYIYPHPFRQYYDACVSIVEHNKDENILIYPNPATEIINIKLGNYKTVSINIYSVDGKKIASYQNINNKVAQINVSNLQEGLYILSIDDGEVEEIRKISIIKN